MPIKNLINFKELSITTKKMTAINRNKCNQILNDLATKGKTATWRQHKEIFITYPQFCQFIDTLRASGVCVEVARIKVGRKKKILTIID